MRILIDADGCPVIEETIRTAKTFGIPVTLLCDTSHVFNREDVEVQTVSKGADSADFALVNLLRKGDIVVTQDYGLAAMCMARGGLVINQDGMEYTDQNMDSLLMARHTAKKIRRGGGRLKGPSKRTPGQDESFCEQLRALLHKGIAAEREVL